MKSTAIKLSEISTTSGTQIRARIDADAVSEYAAAMVDGAIFPPVVVFHDGREYILADGFHRVMACSRNGFKDIDAEVRKGTKSDALKYALGANSSHGIKRTNSDKRRSVELALAEWPKLSDRELAKICAVGATLVADARAPLNCNNNAVETRIGADGKERKLPVKQTSAELEIVSAEYPQRINTTAEEFVSACGNPKLPETRTEPLVVEYYARLEAFVEDAMENASDKQLISMSVYASKIPKMIKERIASRKRQSKP